MRFRNRMENRESRGFNVRIQILCNCLRNPLARDTTPLFIGVGAAAQGRSQVFVSGGAKPKCEGAILTTLKI